MKVNFENRIPERVKFKKIKEGELFGSDPGGHIRYMMKTYNVADVNCVDIESGMLMHIDDVEYVFPVGGETNVWY